MINKDFTCVDHANEYETSQPRLGEILRGFRYEHKGWTLRDSQLAMSVDRFLKEPVNSVIIKHKDTNEIVLLIFHLPVSF